jgi:uncharacterized protein (DUF1501 family)
VVHACGSPDTTRSHFDAQDYMESGTPGVKSTPDGWLGRAAAALPTFLGLTLPIGRARLAAAPEPCAATPGRSR